MLNAVVQLQAFDERQQQLIFRHAVRAVLHTVQSLLPWPYLGLCHQAKTGLSDEAATGLFSRLAPYVDAHVQLPFLEQHAEWQVIHCVLDLLVGAMRIGTTFDDTLGFEHSGPIMMRTRPAAPRTDYPYRIGNGDGRSASMPCRS